jgi:cation transport ATPase
MHVKRSLRRPLAGEDIRRAKLAKPGAEVRSEAPFSGLSSPEPDASAAGSNGEKTMHRESTHHSVDFGRLRLHGWALLSGVLVLAGLLFPWDNFVQLVLKHRVLTGIFFVLALMTLELAGYFLLRAVRERAVTQTEALVPLFYSAAGVLKLIFGVFFVMPINPVATVYLLGAAGLAVGTLFVWPQSPQIRALLNGRAFRYSALGAIAFTAHRWGLALLAGLGRTPTQLQPSHR